MAKKSNQLSVKGADIRIITSNPQDYISLTDITRYKKSDCTDDLIRNWICNRNTVEFIGIWEQLNNPDFIPVEFDEFIKETGLNQFILSVKQWVTKIKSKEIIAKAGRYGGTYAHKDITFEFASWISPHFKLYLIKEFQRLKDEERKQLGQDIRRNLTKINYCIHTDAIKENLIPATLSKQQISHVYATEADILNMTLFGKTADRWRAENPNETDNIRDFTNVSQLVYLANLENLNAVFINKGLKQAERLTRLNQIAIQQMRILVENRTARKLKRE